MDLHLAVPTTLVIMRVNDSQETWAAVSSPSRLSIGKSTLDGHIHQSTSFECLVELAQESGPKADLVKDTTRPLGRSP